MKTMKTVVGVLAVAAVVVVGIARLADLTQNRPDERVPGSETTVEFQVSTRDYPRGEAAAALALWTICSSMVGGRVTPQPVEAAGDWQVRISPAIGEHGEDRLVGCLEDLTVERVIGNVVSLRSG
jgi:hypothetical protein